MLITRLKNMSLTLKLILVSGAILLTLVFLAVNFITIFQIFVINRVAAFQGFQLHESISYGVAQEQQLDIYQPEVKSNELLPVVVFFYGGCWGACTTLKKEQYAFVAEAFTSNKMIAVVVDHRLYPNVNFPDIIGDASSAVEWVHNNIKRYGGDSRRMFLIGHSSGAHVASMLAVNPQHLSKPTYMDIKGFVGLAGPYNFLPFNEDYMPILFGPPMQVLDSQPIHFVDGSGPPSLLLYGAADTRVKPVNIEGMATRIREAAGEVDARIYQDVDHAGIVGAFSVLFRHKKPIFSDTLNFIQKYSAQDPALSGQGRSGL